VAHYRRDVLTCLADQDGLTLTVAADATSLEPGIATVDLQEFPGSVRLVNHRAGRLVWQSGVLRLALFGRYDVFIFVGSANYLSTWIAAVIARMRARRVLFWTIGWHRPDRGMKRAVRRSFYSLANELLLYGRWGFEFGVAAGYPASRMRIVGNSVSRPPSSALPEVVDLARCNDAALVVGAVIRLTEGKGLERVLLAASGLRRAGTDCRVLLAGDGPLRPRLGQMANELDVPLTMVGAAYSADALSAIYKTLDLTVVPGSIGLTAIQSLTYGVPVVTHADRGRQMPEAEAVRDGDTGFTFDPDVSSALEDAIRRYVALAPEERAEMHARCRNEARSRWNADATARQIASAIRGRPSPRT
jgi:glycosyltransferase involved in cell wall biosynthesis